MKTFMYEQFLLSNETAVRLYHEYAARMPIIDYHCHLDPREIAENKRFANLTEAWLYGDHYKWRAMRANGIEEKYVTGGEGVESAWWFNDTKDGMIAQMTTLANVGLLSRFVGMLTDSRSFLSFTRHEYFRRILCNMLGEWVERGEAPNDLNWIGGIVQDISYHNAERYFRFQL